MSIYLSPLQKILFSLIIYGFLLLPGCTEQRKYANTDNIYPEDGQEALQWLIEGNNRFLKGASFHHHESAQWRSRLTEKQTPFATIIGCSDSRVPIELLFDQGFGDLFIIRVAGNIVGTDEKGSVAYAVAHLHTPLILVMGHEGCGAVTAAMLPDSVRKAEPVFLQEVLNRISPALENLDQALPGKEKLEKAIESNIYWSMSQLQKRLDEFPEYEDVLVKGAIYELSTGKVRILE